MNGTAARSFRLGIGLSAMVILGWVVSSLAAKPATHGMPLPTDWSHSHIIFSRPATADQAQWVAHDPRYWQQLQRRNPALAPKTETSDLTPVRLETTSRLAPKGFWEENMGNGTSAGADNYPAKFSFDTDTATCGSSSTSDYVVYPTGLAGSGTQASIVAYNNIYSGCAAKPSIYWAYNTGGQVLTSPILSLDGTQVAFVQTVGGVAQLTLLKWKASTTESIGSPGSPSSVSAAAYHGCTAPCMTQLYLYDGNGVEEADTTSSPFYDYSNDIVWVGGLTGWINKYTGVFKGTPTEVTTGGFPVQVDPSNPAALDGPIYDNVSTNVFVGDAAGFFYRVPAAGGTVTQSAQLDYGSGIVDSPIVDVTNQLVYVFSSSDGTTSCTGGVACSAVYLLSTTFASGATGSEAAVGVSVASGNTPNPLYAGDFDSAYYNSTAGTGNLYVCGDTGVNPILYRVPIASGAFTTPIEPVAALTGAANTPSCSPVTDFANPNASGGPAERLFFSVQSNGKPTGCGKGCIMNFIDTPWQPSTTYAKGQEILVLRTADNSLWTEVAIVGGKSGATPPAWPGNQGVTRTDGGVTWVAQGNPQVNALPAWVANNGYSLHNHVFDGTNVEIVTVAGTSGGATPSWNATVGGNTTDGTVTWINAGPFPSFSLAANTGTGGIIYDNSVPSTTMAGASQVYFFTLGTQTCSTSGTKGVCAVQASQSNLQ